MARRKLDKKYTKTCVTCHHGRASHIIWNPGAIEEGGACQMKNCKCKKFKVGIFG